LPVELLLKVLHALRQRRDALMLRHHLVGLLLHRGVEQQNPDHTDRQDEHHARRKRQLLSARRCRPRLHKCTMRDCAENRSMPRREISEFESAKIESVGSVVQKGQLLVATPALQEPTFARTVIVVLEHDDENGSLGVVLNRPTPVPVADVVTPIADLVTGPPTLFDGGPVAPTTAIAVGRVAPGAEPDGWAWVAPPLVTVDLDHDPALLAVSVRDLRVFAGYAGWAAGQLAGEIEEGAWYVVEGLPDDVFVPDATRLWSDVLRRQGWPLSAVAVCPLDPTMN